VRCFFLSLFARFPLSPCDVQGSCSGSSFPNTLLRLLPSPLHAAIPFPFKELPAKRPSLPFVRWFSFSQWLRRVRSPHHASGSFLLSVRLSEAFLWVEGKPPCLTRFCGATIDTWRCFGYFCFFQVLVLQVGVRSARCRFFACWSAFSCEAVSAWEVREIWILIFRLANTCLQDFSFLVSWTAFTPRPGNSPPPQFKAGVPPLGADQEPTSVPPTLSSPTFDRSIVFVISQHPSVKFFLLFYP